MLAWRELLAPLKGVAETEINILGYVDLYESRQADLEYIADIEAQ